MTEKKKTKDPLAIDFLKLQRRIRENLSQEADGDLEKAAEIWRKGAAELLGEMKKGKKPSRTEPASSLR
ncbi:MAG: hypothetical protein C4523_10925 [Myxococcales bacterium]|nr:MAG: hypothetical protein C4523_10925 [Myxococcales bacterium]